MNSPEVLLEHIKRLYISCRTHYIICRPGQKFYVPKKNGGFFWLTDKVLLDHLRREYAIGVFASNKGSKFICFDVDDGSADTVTSVIDELSALGIPSSKVYVSFSGRKGYHVEVFFDEIIETDRLMNLYHHVIRNGELDPMKVEFRPTAKQAIKLPLSIHGETGNICWYVDPETLRPIEDEGYIATIRQLHVEEVKGALSLPELDEPSRKGKSEGKGDKAPETICDGNVCAILTKPGIRHEVMLKIAARNRRNGISREENQNALEEWYSMQPPEMIESTPEEVSRDITNILNWAYSDLFSMKQPERKDSAIVSEGQLEILMNLSSRSARRVCFLLLARTRMNASRISAADISKTTGISVKTVYEVLHKLIRSGIVSVKKGRRVQLPDQSFASESSSYVVPHRASWPHEMRIEITMRDLTMDFDRTYHKALYRLIRPDKLKDAMTPEEWLDYLGWVQVFESDGDDLPDDRRIDKLGMPYDLALPLRLVSPITAYLLENRWLFPAYNMALAFALKNPSVCGSQCPHKEMWRIQVKRRVLPNGLTYHQVLNMNFIPIEDVMMLLDRSDIPQKDEVRTYLMALDERRARVFDGGDVAS